MSTTCKIEHRDYIPWGWIAIEFCSLNFMGNDSPKYENEWHEIEYSKYHKIEQEINYLKLKKELLQKEINEINNIKNCRKMFHKHCTKEEMKMIKENEATICEINLEIDEKEDNKFYSATRLHHMAEEYLDKNNFRLINCSSSGNECVTKTEIWEKL